MINFSFTLIRKFILFEVLNMYMYTYNLEMHYFINDQQSTSC